MISSQLRSLSAVRQTTSTTLLDAKNLHNFDLNLSKVDDVVAGVLALIERDYATPADIPFHSRWRHFDGPAPDAKRINALLASAEWASVDQKEKVRRIIDLFVVSVLLDAGAGPDWKFRFSDGTQLGRSEGLALASLDWFKVGGFSANPTSNPHRVDSSALKKISPESLEKAFQVSASNPLVGVHGRCSLLTRLADVLEAQPRFFHNKENNDYRPGNLVDFVLADSRVAARSSDGKIEVPVEVLWDVVMDGLSGIWPATRTQVDGVSLGDVWPSKAMESIMNSSDAAKTGPIPQAAKEKKVYVMAFHKLSQWLTYSLMEPLSLLNITFTNMKLMTGLAEYRNGGLFVDMGVLALKPDALARGMASALPTAANIPRFEVFDDAVVEWRALTVALMDLVGTKVQTALKMTEDELPLVKVLEAGTWKLGREVAAKLRPAAKGPPIDIISDGTVF
ncbi:hypothetical protein CcCBS67573_g01519 [Chytriomyces confervae]|uniref:Uracil catabolism protein 4 n=1 Tax=Chytriomyces confervae TaxID=246404 RepID=A0A507FLQ8_9FUNG|nr:hypothetical protein HDU80_007634 [Chytriomyces hyalinus]TPX77182.1 hypothetical protein CcCBS67573_g01519 [Chytriomyces confervae]